MADLQHCALFGSFDTQRLKLLSCLPGPLSMCAVPEWERILASATSGCRGSFRGIGGTEQSTSGTVARLCSGFAWQLRLRVMRCDVQAALYDAKCVVLEREATLASQDKRVLWLETVAQDLQSEIRSLPSGGQY